MKHIANIKNGQIVFDNPDAFALNKAKLEGQKVVLSLEKWRKNRSLNENSYLWGVVIPLIAEHLGYQDNDTESLWAAIKLEVGHYNLVGSIKVPKASNSLNTVEFEKLMSMVRTWASSELQVYIPLPNEPLI